MAEIEFNDFDEYLDKLQKLEKDDVVPIMKMSLYEGAGVVVDGIRSEIQSLYTSNHASQGPMDYEKKALEKGLGISDMESKGDDINVKVGFAGYSSHKTKKYPKGVPVPLIARSILRGTSFRPKNDFVGRAVRKYRKKSIEAMDSKMNELFKKEMNK